jgi:sugar phosphate permease
MLGTRQAVVRPSSSSDVDATYTRYKWVALLAVSFCYLFYYTGRQTFGFAIPGIQKELGLSKENARLGQRIDALGLCARPVDQWQFR